MRTINEKTFFHFVHENADKKFAEAPSLLDEIKCTEHMIASYNTLTKRYYGALYPQTFADCEYTNADIEQMRKRKRELLNACAQKICFLNMLCSKVMGEKFICVYINMRTDLPEEQQNLVDLQKRMLLEDFDGMDYAIRETHMAM